MNSNDASTPATVPTPEAETRAPVAANAAGMPAQTRVLPVIEEVLKIDKRTVDRGGWRLTRRVESHEETVDLLLREQRVSIERRPIGRTLEGGAMPTQRYEGDVLVLPVVREVLVTEKRLMLVEEIRITQTTGSRRETHKVDLRSAEISTERLEPASSPGPSFASTADR